MFIPEMNTCDKCQWWGKPSNSEPPVESWNMNIAGMADCNNPKLEEHPLHGISSGYDAPTTGCGFMTGPKFGCIHWQLKRWIPTPEEEARMAEGAE